MNRHLIASVVLLSAVAVSGCAVYGDGRPYAGGSGYYLDSYSAAASVPYGYYGSPAYYYDGRPYGRSTYIVTPPPRIVVRPRHDQWRYDQRRYDQRRYDQWRYDRRRDDRRHRDDHRHDWDRHRDHRDDRDDRDDRDGDRPGHPRPDADRHGERRDPPGSDGHRQRFRGQVTPPPETGPGGVRAPARVRPVPSGERETKRARRESAEGDRASARQRVRED